MVKSPSLELSICDVGPLYRLTFDREQDPVLTAELVTLLGMALPAPHLPSGGHPMMIWQGPDDFLIAGPIDAVALGEATEARSALFGDAGRGMVAFELTGDALGERLGHDRPSAGLCSRVMRLAGLRVTAIWLDRSTPTVRILVARSHADYLRYWLHDRWQVGDPSRLIQKTQIALRRRLPETRSDQSSD